MGESHFTEQRWDIRMTNKREDARLLSQPLSHKWELLEIAHTFHFVPGKCKHPKGSANLNFPSGNTAGSAQSWHWGRT